MRLLFEISFMHRSSVYYAVLIVVGCEVTRERRAVMGGSERRDV